MVGGRLRLPAKTNGRAWFQATISNRSRREIRMYGKVICLGIRASVMVDLFSNDLVSVVLVRCLSFDSGICTNVYV